MTTELNTRSMQPSSAFVLASWVAMLAGAATYAMGLWNANMPLNEKGYYLTLLLYGLFAAVSLQKSVRDQAEGIPVTATYMRLCWASMAIVLLLLAVGLWNASLADSEKGFYAMAFLLALFSAIAVQKNVRDMALLRKSAAAAGSVEASSES